MDRAFETSIPAMPQYQPLAGTAAPKTPVLPAAENFAFAVRMLGIESSPRPAPLTESKSPVTTGAGPATQAKDPAPQPNGSQLQQPIQPGGQISSASQPAGPYSAAETEKPAGVTHDQSDLLKPQSVSEVTPHSTRDLSSSDASVLQPSQPGPGAALNENLEAGPARPSLPLAAGEAHLLEPELPKTQASSEILLHLTGNDQSSAAIRVADRAGSLSVSVHASDPVLRESLRSNLNELSAQLNSQGLKADVVKSAAAAMHSETQQDSHAGGQRGSQQQPSNGGDRQQQRDRRSNGGQWQQELDQQITGGGAHPGGNG
jgi:hypothetical protein